jgi:hypothetical protein
MRFAIGPLVLITIGVIALLRHFGVIDLAFLSVLWPTLLIVIGVALLVRRPRWHAHARDHLHDRWERRMHRHFGPGWANLSAEERERFREGMREWRSHGRSAGSGGASPEQHL